MLKKIKKSQDLSKNIVRVILKVLHLSVSENVFHLLIQIFNFGIVGVIATLIDFVFLYLFKDLLQLPLIFSNTLAFCISVVYNYWASLMFVFDVNKDKSKKRNFIIFIIFSAIGLLLNDLLVFIITDMLGIYYMISKLIATIFVMIFNFITRKKFLE